MNMSRGGYEAREDARGTPTASRPGTTRLTDLAQPSCLDQSWTSRVGSADNCAQMAGQPFSPGGTNPLLRVPPTQLDAKTDVVERTCRVVFSEMLLEFRKELDDEYGGVKVIREDMVTKFTQLELLRSALREMVEESKSQCCSVVEKMNTLSQSVDERFRKVENETRDVVETVERRLCKWQVGGQASDFVQQRSQQIGHSDSRRVVQDTLDNKNMVDERLKKLESEHAKLDQRTLGLSGRQEMITHVVNRLAELEKRLSVLDVDSRKLAATVEDSLVGLMEKLPEGVLPEQSHGLLRKCEMQIAEFQEGMLKILMDELRMQERKFSEKLQSLGLSGIETAKQKAPNSR